MSTVPLPTRRTRPIRLFQISLPAQIERIRPYGKLRQVAAGEVLFEAGDSKVPVFVVLSGSLNILQPCPDGLPVAWSHIARVASPANSR